MTGNFSHRNILEPLRGSHTSRDLQQPGFLNRRASMLLLLFLGGWLLISYLAVSFFTNKRLTEALQLHSTELEKTASAVTYHFERSILFLHVIPATVADDMTVITALRTFNIQSSLHIKTIEDKRSYLNSLRYLTALNLHLAEQKRDMDVDVIWVMAPNGDCIASSNYGQSESFVGVNYSDRAYFKNAMDELRGMQYAVGRTTNIPGLYFSAPILDGGKVIGAVTVKIDITRLSQWFNRFDCFVTDSAGAIILSNEKRLEHHALAGAPVFKMSADARDKQYKNREFPVLKIGSFRGLSYSYPVMTMPGSDTPYMLAQSKQSKDGYTIFTYSKIPEIEQFRSAKFQFTILTFISGSALILLIAGFRRYLSDMRNAIQVAESASRSKSAFLANMSHEIRTPMNGIIGMTELCLTTNIDSEQQTYLSAVKSSAENLLSIINDILDFSKIEAGKIELDNVPFLLRSTVGQTLQSIAIRAAEKRLEVLFNPAPDTPDALIGDPGRLRQILINLVGNAIKFTAGGQVLVSVRTVEEDENGCLLSFSVQDEGIGIAPEKLGMIFDPFEQADLSTTKSFGGTGLGLTISKNIVELFGGTIRVESEVGKGSTFIFTARFAIQHMPQPVHAALPLKGHTALVVDDVAINRAVLDDFLGNWSVTASQAESAATAIAMLDASLRENTPFDFVLIDVQMPEIDGWQLVEHIRNQPAYDSVYCILMPSAGMRGDSQRCKELKVDGYLTKPIIHRELHDLLCMLISSGRSSPHPANGPVTRFQVLENRQRLSILVAEDVPINQILIKTILARYGHAVTVAGNGAEAVQIWQSGAGTYDLIFMDVQMPVMDGFQATRRIRELESYRGGHIPIVAMTAYAMKEDRDRCSEAGMDDYISKPFQPEDIVSVFKRLTFIDAKNQPPVVQQPPSPAEVPQVDTAESQELVFNRPELLKRLGNQESLIAQFIAMFIETVDQDLPVLEEAIAADDIKTAATRAHSIKGVTGNIGANRMCSVARDLDAYAKAGDIAGLKAHIAPLRSEYERFKTETETVQQVRADV